MAAHTNVCVIGLGSMGMGAARACLQAGLNTWGVDINPDNCRALLAAGAKGAGPSAVPFAAELDAVVLLVVNAAQVRGILFGESGLAAHLKPGTVVMVSSTIASADAQAIAEALAEYQLLMLDAPVSGGAVKAAAGDMTVMASGSDAAFARLAPVLDAVAGKVYRIGSDIGLGSTVKIIHQLLAGVHIAVAAEAMALAARAGIPLETMYDVVTHAAGNWGCKPEPPKFPSRQFHPCHKGIQINHLAVTLKGIVSVQQNVSPGCRRYLGERRERLGVTCCFALR